jgi:cytochrome c biogenesis protein CcdA/glutaredoxin
LPALEEDFNIEYKEFDITDNKNFNLLIKLEEKYGDEGNEVPVIFIGDAVIGGNELYDRLEGVLREYEDTGVDYPELSILEAKPDSITAEADTTKADKKSYVAYFSKTGCKECDRTAYDLNALQKEFPQLTVREYDINESDAMRMNEALCQLYDVPPKLHQATPMVFVGDQFFVAEEARYNNIKPVIEKTPETAIKPPWERAKPYLESSEDKIVDRFQSFGIFTIILAGLIDGINPCAFATIIFFVSYLSLLGRKGKEVLLIGSAYTLAVFISYFTVGVLGLSFLDFLQDLKFLTILVDAIFIITGIIVIIFGIYSLKDYYLYKKGKISEMSLQLPKSIKQKIHKVIREKSRATHFVLAAFVIGFLVSLQELFCTGQVYLPTLIYMSRLSTYKTLAILYLVLYNLLFIVPLVIVFLLVYWGVTSEVIANWMKKNLGTMKILMAIIFFALGVILIGSVIL